MMHEREFRIVANNDMISPGWSANLERMLKLLEITRQSYEHGTVVLEVSPWSWKFENNKWVCYCPGCDYAYCPVIHGEINDVTNRYEATHRA
jgi:hypothetical protein